LGRKRQDNRIVFGSLLRERMSILDDAIREHLELKRQHGTDESELKRLEDEAFGPPGRPEEPDPLAEAPTEFMAQPATPEVAEPPAAEEEGPRRINVADLQEAPPSEPMVPAEDPVQAAPPAEGQTAMEHEAIAEPAPEPPAPEAEEPGPSSETEERHAIAEQPTEFFDVESELDAEAAPPIEAESPSDEAIVEAERVEPRLVPVADEEDEEDEEFWSDQRLSDELDQALESPLTEEHEVPAPPVEPPALASEEEDEEAPANAYDPDTGHEDVLEDTPEFLEDAPEDDDLWFEQKPPKDFDFDD
jgi:hypothetical protein